MDTRVKILLLGLCGCLLLGGCSVLKDVGNNQVDTLRALGSSKSLVTESGK